MLLRRYRRDAGKTTDEAAAKLGCSLPKISRIETGQRTIDDDDLEKLLALYDVVADNETGRARVLARYGRMRGWWQDYDITPDESRYIGLETAAHGIDEFRSSTIPPLLQTEEFAHALVAGTRSDLPSEQRDRALSLQSLRRRALSPKQAPRYRAVLDEAVLHRIIGGRQVMDDQLRRLRGLASRPHIEIRVLPFASGAHPAMDTAFTVLTFAESELPPVARIDSPAHQAAR